MMPILINTPPPPTIEFLPQTDSDILSEARRAAEAHRRTRGAVINSIKPGSSLKALCEEIEKNTRIQLKGELNNGIGFPTGVSLNDCAAHFTFNPDDDDIILKKSDVLKIDFGTHVNGRIMDSAFTICFDPKYENLLKAAKEATKKSLNLVGVDVRVCDIGREVNEVICSYELDIGSNKIPIRPISNLNGHSISQFKIHGGISIPIVDNGDETKIVADSFYACETFATTGNGIVRDASNCSHYMATGNNKQVFNQNTIKVLRTIKTNMKTLPFCPRHVDYFNPIKGTSTSYVRNLSNLGILDPYPPLNDIKNSLVAQFEHTLYLTEKSKIILTEGVDY
ncbi:Methionine aminopeptidase 2 [Dictyocoela roeselum]|nr:Methionine aminopeptidase 2 [Dictyocoela roeselum]